MLDELKRVRSMRFELDYLRVNIELHKDVVPRVSKTDELMVAGGERSGLDGLLEKVESCVEKYDALLREYVGLCDKISANTLILDSLEKQIIELYYIHAKRWVEVSKILHISESWMYKLHRRALTKLDSER